MTAQQTQEQKIRDLLATYLYFNFGIQKISGLRGERKTGYHALVQALNDLVREARIDEVDKLKHMVMAATPKESQVIYHRAIWNNIEDRIKALKREKE